MVPREPVEREATPAPVPTADATAGQRVESITPAGVPAAPERESARDVTVVVQELNGKLEDAFFDYDRAALRDDAVSALRRDASLLLPILTEFPQIKVTVEGHCDERGSAEYNLGLGDHRAGSAVEVLRGLGVPEARMEVVSYGKERPQCSEERESCWRQNRRAHLVLRQPRLTE